MCLKSERVSETRVLTLFWRGRGGYGVASHGMAFLGEVELSVHTLI